MMDTRKKSLAVLLSVVLTFVMVACGNTDDTTTIEIDGVGVSSSTHTDIELTTTTERNTESTESTERRTTERVTTETTTEVTTTTETTTHVAQAAQQQTTETEATASATSTSTSSAPAPTTEATTTAATTTATATEVRECQHNWITQVTQIDHPAVTHTETRTIRKDTGEDVTGQQLVWHDGIHSIRTGSYTVHICQCGFQGSPDEVEAHMNSYRVGLGHDTVQTHTEYSYAEVEDRTITVVDQEAWTENRVTSYVCTICGATRDAAGAAHNDTDTPMKKWKGSFIDSIFTFWRREDT